MGKNVAVFVDVANIFYAAKAAGVDIDYVTLLKAGSAGRDLVRAYAYTGLDPDNDNQRNFHDFLRRIGYKVVSKDIRKYGDGKVKANLDIELVVDMMKTARNLDVAIVVSGDGDFAPAIRAVQEMGVRVEVISFRGNTSSDLMDVADQFTDIVQIAKVEKGSSRSGRRVAGDEADLSMTEVPDKQSEGTGERGRGRGRSRRVAATAAAGSSSRGRSGATAADEPGEAGLVVLPGEKLSRVAATARPATADDDLGGEEAAPDAAEAPPPIGEFAGEDAGEEGRRRRRRRGGRGRGRSRSREDGPGTDEAGAVAAVQPEAFDADDAEPDEVPAPARRAASAFGSVWDSQIGMSTPRRPSPDAGADEEDLEEPSVPEYLLTERRQRDGGRGGRGGRGRGGAYAAALDRERYGGGRGSTPSRFAEPAPRSRDGGYSRADRGDRGSFRQDSRPAPRPSGDEPWSEVPPEIEAMLRAQLGSRPAPAPRAPAAEPEPAVLEATEEAVPAAPARRGRRTTAKAATEPAVEAGSGAEATEAPAKARRAPSRRSRSTSGDDSAADAPAEAEKPAAKRATSRSAGTRRATTRTAAATDGDAGGDGEPATAAPKRRTTRKKAEPAA